jgi:hypothetical protein
MKNRERSITPPLKNAWTTTTMTMTTMTNLMNMSSKQEQLPKRTQRRKFQFSRAELSPLLEKCNIILSTLRHIPDLPQVLLDAYHKEKNKFRKNTCHGLQPTSRLRNNLDKTRSIRALIQHSRWCYDEDQGLACGQQLRQKFPCLLFMVGFLESIGIVITCLNCLCRLFTIFGHTQHTILGMSVFTNSS